MEPDKIRELHGKWRKTGSNALREELFHLLWEKYHPRLQVYAGQFRIKGEDAVDAASEILIAVMETIGRYNDRYAFSTWLYTIARNQMIDRLRRKNPLLEEYEDRYSPAGPTPETQAIDREEKKLIGEALSRLADSDRELVYLHFYEELKYREISDVTGMPLGTVKFRMSEIRKELERDLKECFVP